MTLVSSLEIPEHRRVRYIVDICTGLSEGELAGRIWSDADLSPHPTIEVLNACAMLGTHGWATIATTKNEHRVRKIPLHSAAAAALRWWKEEGWAQYVGRAPKSTDPIFSGPTGKFARPASAKLLRKDLLAAGCPDKRHGHNITAQAMRRCFATYLDTANVPEEQRGRLMGHAKRTVTAKHYTDEQIETDRAAVERIALRWASRADLVSGLVSQPWCRRHHPFQGHLTTAFPRNFKLRARSSGRRCALWWRRRKEANANRRRNQGIFLGVTLKGMVDATKPDPRSARKHRDQKWRPRQESDLRPSV